MGLLYLLGKRNILLFIGMVGVFQLLEVPLILLISLINIVYVLVHVLLKLVMFQLIINRFLILFLGEYLAGVLRSINADVFTYIFTDSADLVNLGMLQK
jgi:hypothetical protein